MKIVGLLCAGFLIPICALCGDRVAGKKVSRWIVNLFVILGFTIYFWSELDEPVRASLCCLAAFLYLAFAGWARLDTFGLSLNDLKDCIVAPVAEELCYRKFIADHLLRTGEGLSMGWCVLISSLLFASAHLVTLARRDESCMFKFGYTFLFSIAVGWVYFACDANLIFAIVLHCFCNFVGIPAFRVGLTVPLGVLFASGFPRYASP